MRVVCACVCVHMYAHTPHVHVHVQYIWYVCVLSVCGALRHSSIYTLTSQTQLITQLQPPNKLGDDSIECFLCYVADAYLKQYVNNKTLEVLAHKVECVVNTVVYCMVCV